MAEVDSLGDGTGGLNSADIIFQDATQALGALLFSLEEFYIQVQGASADREVAIRNVNLGRRQINTFRKPMALNLRRADTPDVAAISPADANGLRGLILGTPFIQGSVATFQVLTANVDTEILSISGMGYVWPQIALQQPGGPQRPPNGLFAR